MLTCRGKVWTQFLPPDTLSRKTEWNQVIKCVTIRKDENAKETSSRNHRKYLVSQFSRSVVSNSLRPHEPQCTRPPFQSPTPGVHPNPCPLSWWCHPTILSSIIPFSSCSQSFPASGSFPMSQWCHSTISSSVVPFSSCSQSFPASGSFPTGWLFTLASKASLAYKYYFRKKF